MKTFFVLEESDDMNPPMAILNYKKYMKQEEVSRFLDINRNLIQCVAGTADATFGKTQFPAFTDYADGLNTLEWLRKLSLLMGPTCVGKTAQSLAIARLLKSPVINCDSRQIYKELKIGVARPSEDELSQAEHYFIASHSIHQSYSAGDYEREAWELVIKLAPSHEYLLMVGGSGFYIDAFTWSIDHMPPSDPRLRKNLPGQQRIPMGWKAC